MSLISLSPEQRQDLYCWLSSQDIPTGQIGKHFADGVEMAKLLKKYYPKWIDLAQYPVRKSTLLKTTNWSLLNTKVLAKLRLFQTKIKIEDFACGTTNAIEILLYKVMKLQKTKRVKEPSFISDTETEQLYVQKDDVITIKQKQTVDGKIVEKHMKLIPFASYEKLLKDIELKREGLLAAEALLAQNTKVLAVRDQRIKELRSKLDSNTAKSLL